MNDLLCGLVSGKSYTSVNQSESQTGGDAVNDIRSSSSRIFARFFREQVPRISRPHEASAGRRGHKRSFVLLLIGLLSIVTGCLVLVLHPYDVIFKWKLLFENGGETYELWRKPPVELLLKVHLFNITNADAFMSGEDDLMNIEEVGPYTYREDLEHANVTFNDNGTLTFNPKHPLTWVQELSNGREDDILTLPNIALLSIANVMRDKSYFTRVGLNMLIRQTNSQPLVQMTAKEFMFGYESPLVTLGNKFMSSWIHFDKLGLIDRMYDFKGDHSTVFTGETNINHGGLIDTYNGHKTLQHWKGEHCSKVHMASDSTKFASYIEPEDDLLFYRKSVCRSMLLKKIAEGDVDGLKAYHYIFEKDSLDNGVNNTANKCFCREGICLPAGLIDVTECYYGFPIAVSYPHFLDSDPTLLELVNGSKPDREKHASHFKIEPKSGLPLDVSVKFQINMALGDISKIAGVQRFKNIILPMLWTEIRMARLPDDLQTLFKLYLNVLPVVQQAFIYLLFATGCVFLVFSIYKALRTNRQQRGGASVAHHIHDDRQRRCSGYLESDVNAPVSKEMELYYSSLLSNVKESDIIV